MGFRIGRAIGLFILCIGGLFLFFGYYDSGDPLAEFRVRSDRKNARIIGYCSVVAGGLLALLSTIRESGNRSRVAAPPGDDPTLQLERLQKLRDSGALTAQEFEAQKYRILNRS